MLLWHARAADRARYRPLRTGAGTAALAAGIAAVAGFVLFTALSFTGTAAPAAIGDPGAFVRWALPSATLVHHTSMALSVASGIFLAGILRPGTAVFRRAATVGAAAASVWMLSAALVMLLGFAQIAGRSLAAGPQFLAQLGYYVSSVASGQARLAVLLAAVVVACMLWVLPTRRGGTVAAVVGMAAVLPLSLIGHASSGALPLAAIGSLSIHVVGVSVWVGGVILLGLLAGMLDPARPGCEPVAVFRRFSTLAGVAFAAVFTSGVVNSVIRLEDFAALSSPYGTLILVKTAATGGLGIIGYLHRRWIARAGTTAARTGSTAAPSRAAWRLIVVEILIMAATMAVAVALAGTAPH